MPRGDFVASSLVTERHAAKNHFFNPAIQFNTTVIGVDGCSICVFTRKRLPSLEGT
jgi:hypothetical protein